MPNNSRSSPPRGESSKPPAPRRPPTLYAASSVYSEDNPARSGGPAHNQRPGPLAAGLVSPVISQPSATVSTPDWTPPVVRGRDQPFPAPRGRQYPVAPAQQYTPPAPTEPPIPGLPPLPDFSPPRRKIERGRGIVRTESVTAAGLRRRADMYFDQTLGEWRPIPPSTQMGIPEENWAKLDRRGEEEEKERKRDKLKKFRQSLVTAVKDLGNPQGKQDKDDEERKSKLAASISAPLGTSRHRR